MPGFEDLTVLLVDDSNMTRKMIEKMLVSLQFKKVLTALEGQNALDVLEAEQDPVDIIISDWNMPIMDGLSLLQNIRADERYKDIPFIMATAQGDKKQISTAKDNGANAVLPKPFPPDELAALVNQVLSGETAEETATTLNIRKSGSGKIKLKMGHIQITDHLALGVMKSMIEEGQVEPKYFELETECMAGWNPIEKALEKGDVDGAFVLAPIAMDLFNFGVPLKLIMLAHKDGSICVRNKKLVDMNWETMKDFFKWKVVLIPHKMSVHNMLAHKYLLEMGLRPGVPGGKVQINVRFEVVPPVKMPEFMANNENVAAFIVAEPIGSKAVNLGVAERLFLSSEQWQGHPCCVCTMRDEIVSKHPDAVHEFCDLLVKAGQSIAADPAKAAGVAVKFLDPQGALGLKAPVLEKVLTEHGNIITTDLKPVIEDLDRMQRYMHHQMEIGEMIDLEKFVDMQFADAIFK